MAFRQPTYHVPQRIFTAAEDTQAVTTQQINEIFDGSQEWILFSPGTASTTERTFTASTQQTRRTTGRSRASAYGSIETAAQSYGYDEEESEIADDEEDGELDSLDSHLQEFHESSREAIEASGNTVLPTHDGLGTFRIDGLGEGAQEHLYAFERYNPRRIKRRRESLELGQLELENERSVEVERARRIEEWRLGQSRALLDEIQKETRRRRLSFSSNQRSVLNDETEEELATLGSVTADDVSSQATAAPADENDGFWSRITRRVIEDLMGIDDRLLSILFGESLPQDDDLSTTPPATQSVALSRSRMIMDTSDDSWESRLLERVALELGILVNQLSDHPGAFSTYLRMQQMPIPYAGLPIIPEVAQPEPTASTLAASAPDFRPTIEMATQPLEIVGSRSTIEAIDIDATRRTGLPIHQTISAEFTKEEWERQLDVKMVFRYLKSRFTSHPVSQTIFRDNSRLATSNLEDSAARAARVRRHHPLVTRSKPVGDRRSTIRVTLPASPLLHRRGSSSCASQSTRKSARRNSGSSRPYWDINGSIGSGSLIASGGGWGEV